jgi:hypothetical protein
MIQNAPSSTEIISYRYHEANWHELIFHRADNRVVDEMGIYLVQLYQRPSSEKIRLLLDTRSPGGLPVIYSYQKMRELIKQYPKRPPMRYAFLSDNRVDLMGIVRSTVLALNPNVDANYFGPGQREAAIAWITRD